jgi:uncharacterized protein (DUF1786 family)
LDTPTAGQVRRLGFMAGEIAVPDDFDRMSSAAIEDLSAATDEVAVGYAFVAMGGRNL